jgi:hypothetical protein
LTDETMTGAEPAPRLRGSLERGGLGPLVLVVVVYLALYLGTGKLAGLVDPGYGDDELLSSVGAVFFQLTVGLVVGSVILTWFVVAMGWSAEIFGRQPVYRSRWMWVAPVLVALPILLRILDIDWGGPTLSVVLLVVASGLLVGYSEELLYRGIAVKMLRSGGHGERAVATLSALLFGLSHSINLFSGQGFETVGPTIVYTFAFGVLMYLSMRVIGFIVGAMVLHGLTDPTGFLASGGIDKLPGSGGTSTLADVVGLVTIVMVVVGLALVLCIRGKAEAPEQTR